MSQLQHLDGYLKAPKTANRAQRAKETAGESDLSSVRE